MDWNTNRQFTSLSRLKYFCCSINYYNYLNRRQNKQKSLSCFCNVKRFVLTFILLIFFQQFFLDVITLETFSFVDQTNVLFTQQIHLESVSEHTITSKNEQTIISKDEQIALLVFCAKRPKAIKNHLEQLNRLRPSPKHFPIFVSQDGFNNEVTSIINEFNSKTSYFTHFQHNEQKNSALKSVINYLRISQHYKWALDKVFLENNFKTVIITEDDLDISPDFFIYFNSTKSLLYSDPSIWCISAWNDNGNPSLVDWENGINKLWRTDFFPGLGWMLRSELWMELRENWPEVYWDDWLRTNNIRHNRACIRPEISRTLHNFSVAGKGSSDGLYKNFLSSMKLEKDNFDIWLRSELENSIELSLQEVLDGKYKKYKYPKQIKNPSFFVRFNDPREYRNLSKTFRLMGDIRSGMMRTAYLGVVPFYVFDTQIFAIHYLVNITQIGRLSSDQIYDTTWDLKSKYLDFSELYCTQKTWTGICDPFNELMKNWFKSKGWMKRLELWGNMTFCLIISVLSQI
ncbi:hypothetical protein Mgra_00005199 [Meloidogyne graminicola]|uniref:Alpha-1,3-mannosyl-glycoprotein 2-beta-N-acetylglucosaminyltransferase n=1 Tax=Meloidogyne graminicola TaxID=189291 RepID=A0A8S9ZPQ2_9BILA|nr:hypothetical protein Mgra_00005199 [Meloidogyne graminicola]